jgi:hypothetical protein
MLRIVEFSMRCHSYLRSFALIDSPNLQPAVRAMMGPAPIKKTLCLHLHGYIAMYIILYIYTYYVMYIYTPLCIYNVYLHIYICIFCVNMYIFIYIYIHCLYGYANICGTHQCNGSFLRWTRILAPVPTAVFHTSEWGADWKRKSWCL